MRMCSDGRLVRGGIRRREICVSSRNAAVSRYVASLDVADDGASRPDLDVIQLDYVHDSPGSGYHAASRPGVAHPDWWSRRPGPGGLVSGGANGGGHPGDL